MAEKVLPTLKQILWLVLVVVGSFFGVQVGNISQPGPSTDSIQVNGRLCGINLDGASTVKKTMANLICERFDKVSNETAQKIIGLIDEDCAQ